MVELFYFFIETSLLYANYLWHIISNPLASENYFYLLILLSVIVWILEIFFPWRQNQSIIRRGFWMDFSFMFFNFFIFNLIFFVAFSEISELFFHKALDYFHIPENDVISLSIFSVGIQIIIYFLLSDFIQWIIHRLLHVVPLFWRFHKVHHSVLEMGFAAHFRFHFFEHFVYKGGLYIFLCWLINFELKYVFYIHSINILIGHLNHSNIHLNYGVLKYVFNNPKLHIWHHSKSFPTKHLKGANFGISLSIWDYLFKTVYMPFDGKNISLGFDKIEKYPQSFIKLLIEPFRAEKET